MKLKCLIEESIYTIRWKSFREYVIWYIYNINIKGFPQIIKFDDAIGK